MADKAKYWIGDAPAVCDLRREHKITDTFIDGNTVYGSWANMCPACHRQYGRGLGTGAGQSYTKQTDGRWLKVAG